MRSCTEGISFLCRGKSVVRRARGVEIWERGGRKKKEMGNDKPPSERREDNFLYPPTRANTRSLPPIFFVSVKKRQQSRCYTPVKSKTELLPIGRKKKLLSIQYTSINHNLSFLPLPPSPSSRRAPIEPHTSAGTVRPTSARIT